MTDQSDEYKETLLHLVEDLCPSATSKEMLAYMNALLYNGEDIVPAEVYINHITCLLSAIARLGAEHITINFLHSEGSNNPPSSIGGQYANHPVNSILAEPQRHVWGTDIGQQSSACNSGALGTNYPSRPHIPSNPS